VTSVAPAGIDWLADAAADRTLHTVRVSWSDRLGAWRGKRVPVNAFLANPTHPIGFCDGMIVVDVQCEILQSTPFSNFTTGYPDMYVRPDLRTLRPAAWTDGEAFVLGDPTDHDGRPLAVAPRVVLARVIDRLAEQELQANVRVVLDGRLMWAPDKPLALDEAGLGLSERSPGIVRIAAEGLCATGVEVEWIARASDPGAFRLALAPRSPLDCADGAIVAKAALKEIARAHGAHATFMTLVPGALAPSAFTFEIEIHGTLEALDQPALVAALTDARALLQPSVTAFKAGPEQRLGIRRGEGVTRISGVAAAAEADPVTALAVALAAVVNAAGRPAAGGSTPERGLAEAAARLGESAWLRDWLGAEFVENALPLLRHEAELFAGAVTDWEVERYWRLG
jgi:glutamine synthetase